MVWLQFSIKILGMHFVTYVLDNNNWDNKNEKLTKKSYLEQKATFFEREKIIVNQILSSKLNMHYSKIYQKQPEKRIYDFLWNDKKIGPPRLSL